MVRKHQLGLAVLSVVVVSSLAIALLLQLDIFTLRSRGVLKFKVAHSVFDASEAAKAVMPRTTKFHNWTTKTLQEQMPIWVVSLARSAERRAAMAGELLRAGVPAYTFFDAVDGSNASAVTEAELNRYTQAWKQHMWHKRQRHYSAKIAIDLSHYRLLERIAATNISAIILEDDVLLVPFDSTAEHGAGRHSQQNGTSDGAAGVTATHNAQQVNHTRHEPAASGNQASEVVTSATAVLPATGSGWLHDALTALTELPQDWEVLYLGGSGGVQLGARVSSHLRALRDATGTFGYVATPAFAHKVLQAASSPGQNTWVDLIFASLIQHQEVQAYIVQRPLIHHAQFASTAAYDASSVNVTRFEQLWGALSLG